MSVERPVRGSPWNQHLPYADEFEHSEAASALKEIQLGLADVVAKREVLPGLQFWCHKIHE